MTVYLQSIELNEFSGRFTEKINFNQGLNFLSGENGTGKTTLIKKIKEFANNNNPSLKFVSDIVTITAANQLEIFALSPKRNSEKKNITQLYQFIRQQNKTIDTLLTETKNKQINDQTFDTYASFGELFTIFFELKCKSGERPPKEVLIDVTNEFNEIIDKIFPSLELDTDWDQNTGRPDVKFKTNNTSVFNIENLSCGQQEILSLAFNLYVTKDKHHIYVIDEPEVHLNWNLEKGLFEYFDWFCFKFNKQLIISTHSRLIFTDKYYKDVKFLVWEQGHVKCRNEVTEEQQQALVGDLLNVTETILETGNSVFVEDTAQKVAIEHLCAKLNVVTNVIICGNCENVKSLFRLSLHESSPVRNRGLFLLDGDNTGEDKEFANQDRIVKLDKYSIESYLLSPIYCAEIFSISAEEVKTDILSIIQRQKSKIFNKGKSALFAQKLVEKLTSDELTEDMFSILDCSKILEIMCNNRNVSYSDYVNQYMDILVKNDQLLNSFDDKLIAGIKAFEVGA